MNTHKEIEAKFIVPDHRVIRQRVMDQGGRLIIPRLLERNLRFDTQDHRLRDRHEVLRLRQDQSISLTYKRSFTAEERQEIELEVVDMDTTQAFLEALGYQVIFRYEKYRETFLLEPTKVMLDELPFGFFVEIEAGSIDAIEEKAVGLGLNWEFRIKPSYMNLLKILREQLNLPFNDADFENFSTIPTIHAKDLNLEDALKSFHQGKDVL
jgi:adenylate cyclase class 2